MKTAHLMQHWLVPLALVSASTAFVHLMYLFSVNSAATHLLYVFFCQALIFAGVVGKNKYILVLGSIVYWLLLFSAIFGLM